MYLLFILLSSFAISEDTYQEVMERGIKLYKNQEYERALKVFRDAEEIEPESDLVQFELAMTYYQLESYKKAYIYAKKVIESGNQELRVQSYVVMAKSLFNRMQRREAYEIFENAIKEIGDNDILYYNYADIKNQVEDYEYAIELLKKAIKNNYLNADCHYKLSIAYHNSKNLKDGILSAMYTLLLEPNKKRSVYIILNLKSFLVSNFLKDKYIENYGDENLVNQNTLTMSILNKLVIRYDEITQFNETYDNFLEENGNLTELEFLHSEIKRIIENYTIEDKELSEVSRDFYLPFFKNLNDAGFLDVYCNYISHYVSNECSEWLNNNPEKVQEFFKWVQGG